MRAQRVRYIAINHKRKREEFMRAASILAVPAIVAMLAMTSSAKAAEIIVLTNQGVASAVRELAPAFERASGHKVVVSFEVGPSLMNKINSNAPADVVTQTPDVIDDLIKKEKVAAGSRADFARAGIGVAVKA